MSPKACSLPTTNMAPSPDLHGKHVEGVVLHCLACHLTLVFWARYLCGYKVRHQVAATLSSFLCRP